MFFLLSLPFVLLHHVLTYLYPLYASYKAISSRKTSKSGLDANQPALPRRSFATGQETTELAELEGWCMYWSVLGVSQLAEAWGEWTWSWIPFYSLIKVAFTLWLVMPQTQGATYLYVQYLGPFLQAHEDDIDVALQKGKQRASEAAGDWLAALWQQVRGAILGAAVSSDSIQSRVDQASMLTIHRGSLIPQQPAPEPAQGHPTGSTQPPPTMHDPASGSANQLYGLLKHYAPLAAAGVVSAMDRAAAAASSHTDDKSQEEPTIMTKNGSKVLEDTGSSSYKAGGVNSIRAELRRNHFQSQLNAMAGSSPAAAAASSSDSKSHTSAYQPPPIITRRVASTSRAQPPLAAALSSDEEELAVRQVATVKDLSGSYTMVEPTTSEEEDLAGEEVDDSTDDEGAGVGTPRGKRAQTPTRTPPAANTSWTSWLRGGAQ